MVNSVLRAAWIGFLGIWIPGGLAAKVGASDLQPNIVLIVADDLGIHDLGCYGRREHRTPAIDALAAVGLRFTDAYSASPLCSSSRAGLMTGKHPARLHLTSYLPGRPDAPSQLLKNAVMHSALPPDEKTIASILRRGGYRTGIFGKWHLGGGASSPGKMGFDVVFEPDAKGQLDEISGAKNEFLIARRAIEFMEESHDLPFLCYIPHHSPHILLSASTDAMRQFHGTFSPLYAASLEALDRSVGMVMDAVRNLGNERETIVIFTSDNGGLHVPEGHSEPVTHNGRYRAGKGFLYEGGTRVPLIVWSDRISFGESRIETAPVSLMDLVPTLARLASLDTQKLVGPLDGIDLSDHWRGKSQLDGERGLFWHFPHYSNQGGRPSSSLRKGRWKLFLSLDDNQLELFDLESDPGETIDLADSQAELVISMRKELEDWLFQTGAQLCETNLEADRQLHHSLYIDPDPSMFRLEGAATQMSDLWSGWRSRMNSVTRGNQASLKSPQATRILKAADARVHGSRLRYESEANKNVIGYWTEVADWVDWELDIDQPGRYQIEIQYGCGAGQGGSEIELRHDDQSLNWQVRDTGHFQNMIYQQLGTLELKTGPQRIEIRSRTKAGVAVMDIRQVTLRRMEND